MEGAFPMQKVSGSEDSSMRQCLWAPKLSLFSSPNQPSPAPSEPLPPSEAHPLSPFLLRMSHQPLPFLISQPTTGLGLMEFSLSHLVQNI